MQPGGAGVARTEPSPRTAAIHDAPDVGKEFSVNRRNVLTTLGATALGAGVLFSSIVPSLAQDAATAPAFADLENLNPSAAFEAERAQAYEDFVAALAGELGDDEAEVDAAIRAALIQAVDVKLAAGEIDEERAAAAKAVIQVSDAPLLAGFGGPVGHPGFKGRNVRGHGQGGPGLGGERSGDPQSRPGDDQSTSSRPSASDVPIASDQGTNTQISGAQDVRS